MIYMDFDDAIKYDNRKFLEYFCQKFKQNQIILFSIDFKELNKIRKNAN